MDSGFWLPPRFLDPKANGRFEPQSLRVYGLKRVRATKGLGV